jgi:hypothetical protein
VFVCGWFFILTLCIEIFGSASTHRMATSVSDRKTHVLFPSDSLTADQLFKRKSWIALNCSANFTTGAEWCPI